MAEKVWDQVVVGAGLAGLAAALTGKRGGADVLVLEKSARPGGLARSVFREGFTFNQGPRAIYQGGAAARILAELGLELRGGTTVNRGVFYRLEGQLRELPGSLPALFQNGLGPADIASLGLAFRRLKLVRDFGHETAAQWLVRQGLSFKVRSILASLVRLSSYCPEDQIDVAAAAVQLRLGEQGVLYHNGGWQSIVDDLTALAERAGVELRTDARVASIETSGSPEGNIQTSTRGEDSNGGGHALVRVRTSDGGHLLAKSVIFACSPGQVLSLLPPSVAEKLGLVLGRARAAVVDCLDLAVRRQSPVDRWLALDCDRQAYFSVHSRFAELAPAGGLVAHLMHYCEQPDAAAGRRDLEDLAEEMLPGYAADLQRARYLPRMVVTEWIPSPKNPRPKPADLTALPGLFFAGDWIESEGMLLDGALSSARSAAHAALDFIKTQSRWDGYAEGRPVRPETAA